MHKIRIIVVNNATRELSKQTSVRKRKGDKPTNIFAGQKRNIGTFSKFDRLGVQYNLSMKFAKQFLLSPGK